MSLVLLSGKLDRINSIKLLGVPLLGGILGQKEFQQADDSVLVQGMYWFWSKSIKILGNSKNLELYYSSACLANGQLEVTIKNLGIVVFNTYTCLCLELHSMLNGVVLGSSVDGYNVCSHLKYLKAIKKLETIDWLDYLYFICLSDSWKFRKKHSKSLIRVRKREKKRLSEADLASCQNSENLVDVNFLKKVMIKHGEAEIMLDINWFQDIMVGAILCFS